MRLDPYRRVLALPGVRSLMLVAVVARAPLTAATITLTLHVVIDLDRGYGAAGLVGAAATVGSTLGGPLLGRLVDRHGLRLVLGITTVSEGLFWAVAPRLSYPALLAFAGLSGLLALPAFSVVRQSLAALVPEDQRRQAYALDSMSVELSFMIGPAVAVLGVTQLSARTTMYAIGVAMVASGIALYVLNPAVRTQEELASTGPVVRRREWFRLDLVALLILSAATTTVLAGTDVALVAELREADQIAWTGVVLAVWGVSSMAGGFAYGVLPRPVPPLLLVGLLGLATIPIGLANGWQLLSLVLIPAGVLCAPALSATADLVSRMVPASARGEATGWHNSALTVGLAGGAPLAGAVIDGSSPAWGFAAVGAAGVGACLAVVAIRLVGGDSRLRTKPPGTPTVAAREGHVGTEGVRQ